MSTDLAQVRRILVVTCEEPYDPVNDTTVLGAIISPTQEVTVSQVNRYLLAGVEVSSRFVDDGLWRVRPRALQQLFHRLNPEFDLYGYQFRGQASRLPEAWQDRLLFLEERSLPIQKGNFKGRLAQDRYVMRLEPEDFGRFHLAHGEEALFRYYLVRPKGSSICTEEFNSLNARFAVESESISDAYFDPLAMQPFLSSCEAFIWYTYSPVGRHADGPQIGVCSRHSWRSFLRRLYRPGVTPDSVYLDLNVLDTQGRYCLDMVRRDYHSFLRNDAQRTKTYGS